VRVSSSSKDGCRQETTSAPQGGFFVELEQP
jgi:hypothetical protein